MQNRIGTSSAFSFLHGQVSTSAFHKPPAVPAVTPPNPVATGFRHLSTPILFGQLCDPEPPGGLFCFPMSEQWLDLGNMFGIHNTHTWQGEELLTDLILCYKAIPQHVVQPLPLSPVLLRSQLH